MLESSINNYIDLLVIIGLSYTFYLSAHEDRAVSSILLFSLFAVLAGLYCLASVIAMISLPHTPAILPQGAVILGLVSAVYGELYRYHCEADVQ